LSSLYTKRTDSFENSGTNTLAAATWSFVIPYRFLTISDTVGTTTAVVVTNSASLLYPCDLKIGFAISFKDNSIVFAPALTTDTGHAIKFPNGVLLTAWIKSPT
jgi:hypothetical protein